MWIGRAQGVDEAVHNGADTYLYGSSRPRSRRQKPQFPVPRINPICLCRAGGRQTKSKTQTAELIRAPAYNWKRHSIFGAGSRRNSDEFCARADGANSRSIFCNGVPISGRPDAWEATEKQAPEVRTATECGTSSGSVGLLLPTPRNPQE